MKDCERESVRHSEKDEENSINDIQRGKKGKTEKQFYVIVSVKQAQRMKKL